MSIEVSSLWFMMAQKAAFLPLGSVFSKERAGYVMRYYMFYLIPLAQACIKIDILSLQPMQLMFADFLPVKSLKWTKRWTYLVKEGEFGL